MAVQGVAAVAHVVALELFVIIDVFAHTAGFKVSMERLFVPVAIIANCSFAKTCTMPSPTESQGSAAEGIPEYS